MEVALVTNAVVGKDTKARRDTKKISEKTVVRRLGWIGGFDSV